MKETLKSKTSSTSVRASLRVTGWCPCVCTINLPYRTLLWAVSSDSKSTHAPSALCTEPIPYILPTITAGVSSLARATRAIKVSFRYMKQRFFRCCGPFLYFATYHPHHQSPPSFHRRCHHFIVIQASGIVTSNLQNRVVTKERGIAIIAEKTKQ